jgi:hypothetical protein
MPSFLFLDRLNPGAPSRTLTEDDLVDRSGALVPEMAAFVAGAAPGDYVDLPQGTVVRLGAAFPAPSME